MVQSIDPKARTLTLSGASPGELVYDQLVLCAGSQLQVPGDPGAVHCADSYQQSLALHDAVERLIADPGQELSVTVVGGGFTGLELAAELADMLRRGAERAGWDVAGTRVRLVEQAAVVAPEFGPNARKVIGAALDELGVDSYVGVRVLDVDAHGVNLADGRRLAGRPPVFGPPRVRGWWM